MSRNLMEPDPEAPDISLTVALWVIASVLAFIVLLALAASS